LPKSIIVCPIFFAQKSRLEAKGEPFLDYYFGSKIFYMGTLKTMPIKITCEEKTFDLWDAPTLKCTHN
jgi:hypothetical protein